MDDQAAINQRMTQIIQNLISKLYVSMTEKDGQTFSALIEFDEQQRISNISNMLVEGQAKMPGFDLITTLNEISSQINSLPEIYKLKSLQVSVGADGQVNMAPTYLK